MLSQESVGQLCALGTAVLWTFSSIGFEAASKRAGSMAVNLLRLVLAFVVLAALNWLRFGQPIPHGTPHQWKWMLLSGVVGFFIGDLALFRAYVLMGARLTSLLMTLAPPIAAVTAYFVFGETLSLWGFAGMLLTLGGIAIVVLERNGGNGRTVLHASGKAVLLGVVAAAGQGFGSILTKIGMGSAGSLDGFAASQMRIIAGVALFAVLIVCVRKTGDVLAAFRKPAALLYLSLGAITGPVLGVSLLNLSLARIPAGVAQTLVALVPIFLIPHSVWVKRERVSLRAMIGAAVAVTGVGLLVFR